MAGIFFVETIFMCRFLVPLEFFVHLKTCFLDLHQVKVICYCRYLMLFSNKEHNWKYHKIVLKKSWNNTKCNFHERQKKSLKHFAERVSVCLEASMGSLQEHNFFCLMFCKFLTPIMNNIFSLLFQKNSTKLAHIIQ